MNRIQLILTLCRNLLEEPRRLRYTEALSNRGSTWRTLTITTWGRDQPRLVGRRGGTINALTAIAAAMDIELQLTEPEPIGEAVPVEPFTATEDLIKALSAALEDRPVITIQGDHVTVTKSQLDPVVFRAICLVLHHNGVRHNQPSQIEYT